ncbi:MAG TPA: homoserine dehydrogenase [Ornithinimicrobium sp.]|uniref:homoserine dehydrogenase n=1 Tax=Ornithinimicrobium sp. TaxID=1977084 RepID=UPI002B465AC7|nr:homoserine dehydrogenase [Ornithinimicrobium sp.]HKJ12825.1 homoserine dehydrogenase [Ornithinimicrobium sp.]
MSAPAATGQTPLRVGLLGCGTVGAAVAQALSTRPALYAERVGSPIEVCGIAVRNVDAPRELHAGLSGLLTTDASSVVHGADLVVEVMGGIEPAQSLVRLALEQGKPVVTANKQLIAASGQELVEVARQQATSLDYEAAVAAAVPVLRVVRESLAGDRISSITGIVNGSTNFVLDMVARHGLGFAEAVERAGQLGYLEADPTEDLDGLDAAAKIVILARTAWMVDVGLADVHREGIAHLTDDDFEAAASCGQVIKLVASAWASGDPAHPHVEMAVRPVALGADDPLAQVREGRNGVVIEAESAGLVSLFGPGAGGPETASAVLGDLVNAACRLRQ